MEHHIQTPVILIYGLSGMQLLSLTALAKKAGVTCRGIDDGHTTYTIARLLSDQDLTPAPSAPLGGKFALLHGFDGREQLAAALINQVSGGVIKAIHTPHNDGWSFASLCAELRREHQAMTGKRNG